MQSSFSRALLVAVVTVASGACERPGSDASNQLSTGVRQDHRPASPQVRELTGLSHLPAPVTKEALAASMRRHYPKQFIGVRPRTAVLVDVDVNASGIVEDVRVVDRTGMDDNSGRVRAVVRQKVPGTNQVVDRELNATYDAAFGPAAQAALKEVRFQPAIKDGQPVPFTMRITVEFADPASRA